MAPLIVLYVSWIKWLEANMLTCPSVKYFSIECPGCGMQRSLIALLKGNLPGSLLMYPALLPLLLLCVYALLHLKYKFSCGSKIIIGLQMAVVSIITAHYIYKIVTHQIFH